MIKMVTAKATSSNATHELRREFYEKYKEDFAIIKEYSVPDAAELAAEEKIKTEVAEEKAKAAEEKTKVLEEKAKSNKGK